MQAKGYKPPDWQPFALPLAAAGFFVAKSYDVLPVDNAAAISAATLCLLGTVFAAVHHAEIAALEAGERPGSLILTIGVTVIEAALIAPVMISAPSPNSMLARNTGFSAVAIVLGGGVERAGLETIRRTAGATRCIKNSIRRSESDQDCATFPELFKL